MSDDTVTTNVLISAARMAWGVLPRPRVDFEVYLRKMVNWDSPTSPHAPYPDARLLEEIELYVRPAPVLDYHAARKIGWVGRTGKVAWAEGEVQAVLTGLSDCGTELEDDNNERGPRL